MYDSSPHCLADEPRERRRRLIHDLANLVGVMGGFAEIARRGAADEAARANLDIIGTAAAEAGEVLSRLRALES
ncbi:MAG: hypothetical protein HQL41_06895 [Alphaproteobacteria bacterium]|nr:hypothetical protein [Alphaproteobacteria bacterium]